MAASTACSFYLSARSARPNKHVNPTFSRCSFRPISFSNTSNPTLTLPRLRVCNPKSTAPSRSISVFAVSEKNPEAESSDSNTGATIDIKLPRRNLLVEFTCDDCLERTKRLINRLAHEQGLVFVQCAGCHKYHKLVDNLGLVVEYDFREEISLEPNTDQILCMAKNSSLRWFV